MEAACNICGTEGSDKNCRLPEALQPFFLRSILQLSYKAIASFQRLRRFSTLCDECLGLVEQAFKLEEDAHAIKVKLNKVIDKVRARMKENEDHTIGVAQSELTSSNTEDGKRCNASMKIKPELLSDESIMEETDGDGIPETTSDIELGEYVVKIEPRADHEAFVYEDSTVFPLGSETAPAYSPSSLNDFFLAGTESQLQSSYETNLSTPSTSGANPLNTGHYCKYRMCGLPFVSETRLQSHYLSRHRDPRDGERGYFCKHKDCRMMFANGSLLLAHKKRKHASSKQPGVTGSGKRRKVGTKAGRQKTSSISLATRGHGKLQSWQYKPYPCEWKGCGEKFETTFQLRDHIYSAHKNMMRHKYKCIVPGCGREFKYENLFIAHQARCQFKFNCMNELESNN